MKYYFRTFNMLSCFNFHLVLFILSIICIGQWSFVLAAGDDENIDPRKDPLLGNQFADNVKALLYTGGNDEMKEFKWSDAASLTNAGFKKGEKYRWIIHDWCGDLQDMLPLARSYKRTYPEDNVILIDFSQPRAPSFDTMKTLVKNYAVQSVYFLYAIFDNIDQDASEIDIRRKSHVVGFGFGALIGAWFGAAAAQKSRNLVKQLGYPFKSDGEPYVFRLPRLTILDPIGKCIYIEEKSSPDCAGVVQWPQISITKAHALFTDALYTSKASIPTLCPRDDGRERIAHHRGVYFNENGFNQPGCDTEESFAIASICDGLSKSCAHGKGVKVYAGIIPILALQTDCDMVVQSMFGDRNPNRDEANSIATNFHVDTTDPLPFSKPSTCDAVGEPVHPDYNSLYPECGQQNVEINSGPQWKVKSDESKQAITVPAKKKPEDVQEEITLAPRKIEKEGREFLKAEPTADMERPVLPKPTKAKPKTTIPPKKIPKTKDDQSHSFSNSSSHNSSVTNEEIIIIDSSEEEQKSAKKPANVKKPTPNTGIHGGGTPSETGIHGGGKPSNTGIHGGGTPSESGKQGGGKGKVKIPKTKGDDQSHSFSNSSSQNSSVTHEETTIIDSSEEEQKSAKKPANVKKPTSNTGIHGGGTPSNTGMHGGGTSSNTGIQGGGAPSNPYLRPVRPSETEIFNGGKPSNSGIQGGGKVKEKIPKTKGDDQSHVFSNSSSHKNSVTNEEITITDSSEEDLKSAKKPGNVKKPASSTGIHGGGTASETGIQGGSAPSNPYLRPVRPSETEVFNGGKPSNTGTQGGGAPSNPYLRPVRPSETKIFNGGKPSNTGIQGAGAPSNPYLRQG